MARLGIQRALFRREQEAISNYPSNRESLGNVSLTSGIQGQERQRTLPDQRRLLVSLSPTRDLTYSLQHYWYSTEAQQTYESCIDFQIVPKGQEDPQPQVNSDLLPGDASNFEGGYKISPEMQARIDAINNSRSNPATNPFVPDPATPPAPTQTSTSDLHIEGNRKPISFGKAVDPGLTSTKPGSPPLPKLSGNADGQYKSTATLDKTGEKMECTCFKAKSPSTITIS